MSDDSWVPFSDGDSSSDDGGLLSFLNTEDSESGHTVVDPSDPVQWSKLGKAIGLSSVTAISVGFLQIPINWTAGFQSIVDGAVSFYGSVSSGTKTDTWSGTGLLGEIIVPIGRAYEQEVFEASIESFGIFGWPISVAITLVIIGIVSIGLQKAGQTLSGGD